MVRLRAASARAIVGFMVNGDVVITWPAYEADGPTTGAMLTQAGLGIRLHPRTDNRTPKELADIVGDAVGVIASTDPFDASVFAACPNLRVIARTGIGVDAIDLDAVSYTHLTLPTIYSV